MKLDKECRLEPEGEQYMGTQSRTVNNNICQSWSEQRPHNHQRQDPNMFPDDTLEDAENFCRNTGIADGGFTDPLWCFTTNATHRYEACFVPMCGL